MKEIQIPRKNFARSSDLGSKRLKDSEMKNRKVSEKRQSATFSDVSFEVTKDSMDFTPISKISGAISDSEAESIIMQGSSPDLLSMPENFLPTDESPASTITSIQFHVDGSSTDRIQSIADLPSSMQSLRVEINELKKQIYSVDTSEESNWIDGVVTVKFRIVLLSFIFWAILAAIVVFFSSGEEVTYYGSLPT
ncbi:Protein SINE3 [Cardamine amara subsp. amara]|uniref:Protein SINE3 n=1 Tax=Cardamine amara subsp. amara TaxID=228776 RepID=A0ABD1B0D6_CARAN